MSIRIVLFFFFLCIPALYADLLPAGGEQLQAGQSYTIRWDKSEFATGQVDVLLWDGRKGEWSLIAGNVMGKSGAVVWSLPGELQGDRFRVKVQSISQPSLYRMSATFFTILSTPPQGGQLPVEGSETASPLHISPNPASERVAVSWEGEAIGIRLWDIPGRTVLSVPLHGEMSILLPLQSISPGMYIVEVALRTGQRLHDRVCISR